MSRFNHEYKNTAMAVGLTKERGHELEEIVAEAYIEGCTSEIMEKILDNGLTIVEALYAGYLLGMARQADTSCQERAGVIHVKSMDDLKRLAMRDDIPSEVIKQLTEKIKSEILKRGLGGEDED